MTEAREFVITGRDPAGSIVASETADSIKVADKVSLAWRESGLAVAVEERAPEIPPVCPVI
jgi:hypothetical protein